MLLRTFNDLFTRINNKKVWAPDVTDIARKVTIIIWNMFSKGEQYNPLSEYLFLYQKRKKLSKEYQNKLLNLTSKRKKLNLIAC